MTGHRAAILFTRDLWSIKSYIDGTLAEIGDATCDHHEHEGHGEHGCGHGGCHH